MERTPVRYIKDPKVWRVLLSPIRSELVQALRCIGPCSAAELAQLVDRPPDGLYHHLGLLIKNGYVVESGIRKLERSSERMFDVAADDFAIDFPGWTSEQERAALSATARSFLGTMVKTVEQSSAAGAVTTKSSERNIVINYEMGRLTPEEFRTARALLYELKLLFDRARSNPSGRLYASVYVVCPVTRRRRREPEPPPAQSHRPSAVRRSKPTATRARKG